MTYLFNENPLVIDRELAVVIGLNEAMILQQMQYWIKKSTHSYDGKTWIYNSVSQWKKQFPFFSDSTINRAIKKLESEELVFVGNYNKDRRDRTRWYSINYCKLNDVMKNAISQNDECNKSKCTNAISQNDQMQQVNLTSPLPEITTEITTETTTKRLSKKSQPKKASHLPDDFQPTEHHREIAHSEQINLETEFIKFRDYCLANGKKYVDWNAGFNNWLRNAGKYSRDKQKTGGYKSCSDRNREVLESMRS